MIQSEQKAKVRRLLLEGKLGSEIVEEMPETGIRYINDQRSHMRRAGEPVMTEAEIRRKRRYESG